MSAEDLVVFRAAVKPLSTNFNAIFISCRGGACKEPVASHCPTCVYGYCKDCFKLAIELHAKLQCRYVRSDCIIVRNADEMKAPTRLSLQEAKNSTDASNLAFTMMCICRSDAVPNKKWFAVAWSALRFGGLTAVMAFMLLDKNHQLSREALWSRLSASPSMDDILYECADLAEASLIQGSTDSMCQAGSRACEVILCQDADWFLRNHSSLAPKLVLPMLEQLVYAQLTEATRADALKIFEHGFTHGDFHIHANDGVSCTLFRAPQSPRVLTLFLTKLLPHIVAKHVDRYYAVDACKALPTLLQAPECGDESVLANLANVLTTAPYDDVVRTLATCHSDVAGSLALQLARLDGDAGIAMLETNFVAALAPHLTPTLAEQLFWEVHLHMCAVCHVREKVRKCGRCKLTYYCSAEHQAEDWTAQAQHKRVCPLSLRERMDAMMANAAAVDRAGDALQGTALA